MIEITDAMVTAYQHAWHGTPEGVPGTRTRAGLRAVLDMVELEHPIGVTTTLEPDPMGVRAEALRLASIVCQPVTSYGGGSSRMPAGHVLDMADTFTAWLLTGRRDKTV